jgi:hypothetical protein
MWKLRELSTTLAAAALSSCAAAAAAASLLFLGLGPDVAPARSVVVLVFHSSLSYRTGCPNPLTTPLQTLNSLPNQFSTPFPVFCKLSTRNTRNHLVLSKLATHSNTPVRTVKALKAAVAVMARSTASRNGAFCCVCRVKGAERDMWRGSWAPRSFSRRLWRVGAAAALVGFGSLLGDCLVEVVRVRRVESSVGEGYPRAR